MVDSETPSRRSSRSVDPEIDRADAAELSTASHASPNDSRQARRFAIAAARLLNDLHCTDILLYDVRGRSNLNDFLILATGTSDRQIRSVADVVAELAREYDLQRFGREIDPRANWVVVDFVHVVVHLFEPVTRAHYDLEMMWGDAPKIRWRRSAAPPKPGASS